MSEFYELDDNLVVVRDEYTYPIILTWDTVPDWDVGYAKGCIFLKTDAWDWVSWVYFNKWTTADCDFELAPVASTGSVTDLTVSWTSTLTWDVTWAAAIISTWATSGVWYATGAGWAVTQITNRSTWVTINTITWTIQTDVTSLASWASAEFTVTNSAVAIWDIVVVSQQSGSDLIAGVAGTTVVNVVTVAAGSFEVSVNNLSTTTAETGAIIINFAIIKGVAA